MFLFFSEIDLDTLVFQKQKNLFHPEKTTSKNPKSSEKLFRKYRYPIQTINNAGRESEYLSRYFFVVRHVKGENIFPPFVRSIMNKFSRFPKSGLLDPFQ